MLKIGEKKEQPFYPDNYSWQQPLYSIAWLDSEQPTTCPFCGARTGIIFDLSHSIGKIRVEKCLSDECGFEFAVESEENEIK